MTLEEIEYSIREYKASILKVEERRQNWTLYTSQTIKANIKAVLKKAETHEVGGSIGESENGIELKLPNYTNLIWRILIFFLK